MIEIDVHEPSYIADLIQQVVIIDRKPLNEMGYADYRWNGHNGVTQVERKTWGELLANPNAVEEQLARQRTAHPEIRHILILEGIMIPVHDEFGAHCATIQRAKGNPRLFYQQKGSPKSPNLFYTWLYQASTYIEVFQVPERDATAKALVAFFNADQKEENRMFHRHLKQITFHPNPQVMGLMGIMPGTRMGPLTAERLIAQYGTVWNVINASVRELATMDGIGEKTARSLLQKVGRADI